MKFILPVLCAATLIFGIMLYNKDAITTRDEYAELNSRLEERIWKLEEKIYWLETVSNKTLILEQLLTPQMNAELEALNEQIKQTATSGSPKGD